MKPNLKWSPSVKI
jgi:phosphatidylinositol 4-phosphatase